MKRSQYKVKGVARMKTVGIFHVLVIAGVLASAICAAQESSPQIPFSDGRSIFAPGAFLQADTADTNVEGDDPGSKPQSEEDSRDRIFYPGDTERPKPLLRKLALNIVLDEKDIFTSPFHANRHNALQWLIPLAVVGALIPNDRRIANSFENSSGQVRWGNRISNIGASYTLIPIVAGSYIYGAWRDNPKQREVGVLGSETLLDSLIVVEVMKEIFRRDRPDDKHPGHFWAGGSSFPSGHAIETWSIASLLDHEYRNKKIVGITAYALAGIVSAARIAARKHFASDVVAGGTMGWFIGSHVYDTHMSHLSHKHESFIPMIVPQTDPAKRSYGVSLIFNPGDGR
jgi:membrane-associated phospholipid phosphatase